MPQVSLYFDDILAAKISKQAKISDLSVSRYVSNVLYNALSNEWPQSFIRALGSLNGIELERPDQPDEQLDVTRVTF